MKEKHLDRVRMSKSGTRQLMLTVVVASMLATLVILPEMTFLQKGTTLDSDSTESTLSQPPDSTESTLSQPSDSQGQFHLKPLPDITTAPPAKPGPFSTEELQARLSSFDASGSFASIGGYLPDTDGTKRLLSVISPIEEQGYHIGFVLMDINTGYGIAYNADEMFYSASSIKGPYVASLTAEQPDTIDSLTDSLLSVVKDSNNEEYFFLRSLYGEHSLQLWCEEAGVDTSVIEDWFPFCSSRMLSKLWLRVYEYFLDDSDEINKVKSWYLTSFNSPIQQTLDTVYPVCTKPGWIGDEEYSATVDAGIVYVDENPYLLIIMSDIPDDFTVFPPLILALNEIHDDMCQ